jgi:hypothetical protein
VKTGYCLNRRHREQKFNCSPRVYLPYDLDLRPPHFLQQQPKFCNTDHSDHSDHTRLELENLPHTAYIIRHHNMADPAGLVETRERMKKERVEALEKTQKEKEETREILLHKKRKGSEDLWESEAPSLAPKRAKTAVTTGGPK